MNFRIGRQRSGEWGCIKVGSDGVPSRGGLGGLEGIGWDKWVCLTAEVMGEPEVIEFWLGSFGVQGSGFKLLALHRFSTWGICTRREGKLYKARSRLY